ncbi:MAG: aminotransferase class V-fold PLP-dependent enzyme [Planctomycetota bacterium]|nr:MAG: aminotransferase class V-fold PLP-dependent enzyme [Planctomycetota bacterium]
MSVGGHFARPRFGAMWSERMSVDATAWQELRKQMPVCERWAYFDHAAVAPIPDVARRAIIRWAEEAATEAELAWPRWRRRLEDVRTMLARLLNADRDEIALVRNTTEGLSIIAEGFPWQAGDNVVVAEDEFPTNLFPWLNLRSRGVVTRLVPSRQERVGPEDFARCVDARTRMIAVSWVAFATGHRRNLDGFARLAHSIGAWLVVDGIQALGAFPLDTRKIPIDALAADGHKWLLGPEGAGCLFVRRERIGQLRPVQVGWNSVRHAGRFDRPEFALKDSAARFEGGSPNMAGFHALAASLELLEPFPLEGRAARLRFLTDRVVQCVRELGGVVCSDRSENAFSGIVAAEFPGVSAAAIKQRCLELGVVLNERAGRVRISPHVYTSEEDIARLRDALKSVL